MSDELRKTLIQAAEEEISEWREDGATKSEEFAVAAIDGFLDGLEAQLAEWIEAEAQLSTKPGPLKIQNWRRLWPDQVLNLLVVLRESGNE